MKNDATKTAKKLGLVAVAMFGFGYLMVPIYNVLCDITGFTGKTGIHRCRSSGACAATAIGNRADAGNGPACAATTEDGCGSSCVITPAGSDGRSTQGTHHRSQWRVGAAGNGIRNAAAESKVACTAD